MKPSLEVFQSLLGVGLGTGVHLVRESSQKLVPELDWESSRALVQQSAQASVRASVGELVWEWSQ